MIMIEQTQLEFLQEAKAELAVTWDALAALADIAPRALKTYRLPTTSPGYRGMPKLAHNAIVGVLEKNRRKLKKTA
jgi:hypothetical protein